MWTRGVTPMFAHQLSFPFPALSPAAKFPAVVGISNRNLHKASSSGGPSRSLFHGWVIVASQMQENPFPTKIWC